MNLELCNSGIIWCIPASGRSGENPRRGGELRELPGPAAEDIDLASVMHALADPSRLRTVSALAGSAELCCADLGELPGLVGLAKSTRSHHLRVLREAGVIRTGYDGQRKFVALRRGDLAARVPGAREAVQPGARPQLTI